MNHRAAPADPCDQALDRWCQRCLPDVQTVAVAYSAGADSTALLLAAHRRWPGRVVALHVNHGLQTAAHTFEAHARSFCTRHGIALAVKQVQATKAPGQSPEDAARVARYAALSDMARTAGAGCVLLGQHADDQAETLLLALSRGAGLPGLAGMPEQFERGGMVFGRPLLTLPGHVMRGGLQSAGHAFVDDPSNTDTRFTRNRIRALLMPAWDASFPGFQPMLARSARHAAQAQRLLDELAAIDLGHTGSPPLIERLQSLSGDRQANALRHWMRGSAGAVASTAQLDELVGQINACTTRGHHISIKVGPGRVERDGGCLRYTPDL